LFRLRLHEAAVVTAEALRPVTEVQVLAVRIRLQRTARPLIVLPAQRLRIRADALVNRKKAKPILKAKKAPNYGAFFFNS
jgi:hypothetical protein